MSWLYVARKKGLGKLLILTHHPTIYSTVPSTKVSPNFHENLSKLETSFEILLTDRMTNSKYFDRS